MNEATLARTIGTIGTAAKQSRNPDVALNARSPHEPQRQSRSSRNIAKLVRAAARASVPTRQVRYRAKTGARAKPPRRVVPLPFLAAVPIVLIVLAKVASFNGVDVLIVPGPLLLALLPDFISAMPLLLDRLSAALRNE